MKNNANFLTYKYPENLYRELCDGTEPPKDFIQTLAYVLEAIPPRTKELIIARYSEKMGYRDLGERFGFSHTRAQQIISKALKNIARLPYVRCGLMGYTDVCFEKGVESSKAFVGKKMEQIGYEHGYEDGKNNRIKKSPLLCMEHGEITIDELDLTIRSYNGLANNKCFTVKDIIEAGDRITEFRNLGKKSVTEIIMRLNELNIDVRKIFPRTVFDYKLGKEIWQ